MSFELYSKSKPKVDSLIEPLEESQKQLKFNKLFVMTTTEDLRSLTAEIGGPFVEDNGYAVQIGSSAHEMYCFKDIPSGWKATAFRLYGNSADTTTFYSYEINDTTATADGNTGTLNGTEVTLASEVASTATNYVGIKIATNSTNDLIYGGYIKIKRI